MVVVSNLTLQKKNESMAWLIFHLSLPSAFSFVLCSPLPASWMDSLPSFLLVLLDTRCFFLFTIYGHNTFVIFLVTTSLGSSPPPPFSVLLFSTWLLRFDGWFVALEK
jgi:hypothetical protein